VRTDTINFIINIKGIMRFRSRVDVFYLVLEVEIERERKKNVKRKSGRKRND